MCTSERLLLKKELRNAIDKLDIKESIYLATLLGLNKNKICMMSGVDTSNFYKYLKTNKGFLIFVKRSPKAMAFWVYYLTFQH